VRLSEGSEEWLQSRERKKDRKKKNKMVLFIP
jgi:hypothetical protein